MSGKKSFGVILKMGATSGTVTTTIGKTVTVSPPRRTRDAVDVTTHASADGAEEFIADGVYNGGTVELTMNYIAGDADDDACNTAFAAGEYYISWTANAATGTETFGPAKVVVTGYGPNELPVKGKQTATLTCQISGTVAQAATV